MYNNILVPVDGSKSAELVLPHVEAVVKAHKSESVTFVRVLESIPEHVGADGNVTDTDLRITEATHLAEAEQYLKNLIKKINWGNVQIKSVVLPPKHVAPSIAKFAKDNDMDLIIIATHGRSGVFRWFLGSVAENILRLAPIPVLMIRVTGKGS
jgi:nucleotide-binding universal stress UspA family protein